MADTINGPFQLDHADLADLNFLNKYVAPKYCVVCEDIFISKMYMADMKQKSQLRNKLKAFHEEIDDNRSYVKKRIASHETSNPSGIQSK